MSYIICADCSGAVPKRYDAGECVAITKLHGSKKALFVRCDDTWTDIFTTGAAGEWEAKLIDATPTIAVSPSYGRFVVSEGSSEVLINLGASLDVLDVTEHTFEFTTVTTAADYDVVEDWYQSFYKNHAAYRLNWFDFDENRIYTDHDTVELFRPGGVTATPPLALTTPMGFSFSLSQTPQFIEGPNGFGKSGVWKMAGKFSTSNVLRSIEIPGLKTVLDANG